jgi:hypothetical protein
MSRRQRLGRSAILAQALGGMVALAVLVAGCSTPLTTREKGALVGGAVGAGAGAAIGSASGNAATGALIGAGVGVVSGALIGDAMQANEQQPAAAPPPPPPPPVSVAPAPEPVIVVAAPPPPPPPVVVAPPPPSASVSVDIRIGTRPAFAAVPGTAVAYAPSVSYNYFAYGGSYYVYHQDAWLVASSYNGPWTVIALERVPRPLLTVPVQYYKAPPKHWKQKHGPPPWAPAKGHAKKKGSAD